MFLPRMFVNSSMHACLLVRLLQGTPLCMTWFWRRLLITLHASDFQPYCRIGPGLRMPIRSASSSAMAFSGATSYSSTTSRSRRYDELADRQVAGWFQIGDDVTIFTGRCRGAVAIGDSAVIGANSLIVKDIPAGHIVARGRYVPPPRQNGWGSASC